MERPFHRRRLSNVTGKNVYDGVFSGNHRAKFDGGVSVYPAVNVDEYSEIFSSGDGASSIPVLDLSNLDESPDCLSSKKPDYGNIFGGFRDLDIAVTYEELLARDKISDPSLTSQSSQDFGDESHRSSDALKPFNMSYNKINQRSKNGFDGTTHITQLHAVPGFTCFIDESASQPKKETVKQNSYVTNNVQPSVIFSKRDLPEKQTSRTDEESSSKHHQDDKDIKTFQADLESHSPKVSSSPAVSQPKKEMEKQKSVFSNNIHPSLNSSKQGFEFPEKQTSQNDVESGSGFGQDESLSGDTNFKTFQSDLRHPFKVSLPMAASTTNDKSTFEPKKEAEKQNSVSDDINLNTFQPDLNSHPSKVSPSPAVSSTNLDNHKAYQKTSHVKNTERFKSEAPGGFPPSFFDEEVDVNSSAAVSTAALRKAIEKAQESIRIAKESVGRKKEGLRGFSRKSFKDSLKVKTRVANASTIEEQKEKDDKMEVSHVFSNIRSRDMNGGTVVFPGFADGEKLFGTKKIINEIHGKNSESANRKYEIPLRSSLELRDDKIVCNSKEKVIETEAVYPSSSGNYEYAARSFESIENSTREAPHEDNQRPNGFIVFKSFEEKADDTEEKINNENKDEARPNVAFKLDEGLNNLTVYEKVEDEKKISAVSDQNGYEKRFSEVLGLLENKKQEVHEQEHDEEEVEDEIELKEEGNTKIQWEDTSEKFYDVCEEEMIENVQTYSLGTNEVSSKPDCEMKEKENDEPEETWKNLDTIREPEIHENSSSDYDDAEESASVHSASHIVVDTQETGDVSSSSEFQVEHNQDIEEKDIFNNVYVDQTISEDEDQCETKSDDLSDSGLADMEFRQNDARSESSSDTIHGMEIEVNEYKEREDAIFSEDEEEINLQSSHEETKTPEIEIKLETETETGTGTSQEPKDEVVEKEQTKRIKEVTAEEREQERIKLAVERAIREARERAFIEARERAERAAAERTTAEVRQRVMADAQERVAKASDKTSASRLRAERAAVERATTEARQRALEKAMSQKKTYEPKIQITEIKQASSSVTQTSAESALRSKAKLEKHNRIMERAAKALAEKEKRDMLVLKEQAERSRLSENLDADIKRWSSGKEGNLRALLSTLQYILGADSGWQALSLTEIITASAVKKAYRKATLCVHPDKLQQRGASIQQKYICEKVFDLLKAAWNRFNSEER